MKTFREHMQGMEEGGADAKKERSKKTGTFRHNRIVEEVIILAYYPYFQEKARGIH